MARKRTAKPRSFFEPWTACKSTLHGQAPIVDGIPEDAATTILDAWQRIDRDADWILWGSQMAEPAIAQGYLSGKPVVCDDRRILAVRRTLGLPDGSPTNEEVTKRIAECVNALAGIADPVAFIEDVRSLLKDYSIGVNVYEPATADLRFLRLWCLCVPLEERQKEGYGEQPAVD